MAETRKTPETPSSAPAEMSRAKTGFDRNPKAEIRRNPIHRTVGQSKTTRLTCRQRDKTRWKGNPASQSETPEEASACPSQNTGGATAAPAAKDTAR